MRHRTSAHRTGRVRVAIVALVAAALLAACAPPLPEPQPQPVPPAPLPVLEMSQADDVLRNVGEVLASADSALDPAALAPRVEDPALAMRTAQYALSERSGGARVPTPLTTDDQLLVVEATDTWPRTVLAVTTPPDGLTVNLLLVLRQEDPRSQYNLWSWSRLFPGVETPPLASPEVGSPAVAADAEGLVATPAETVAQYADILQNGAGSAFAAEFQPDPFSAQVRSGIDNANTNLAGIATLTTTAAPVDGQVVALGTADGGAIVVGGIRLTSLYTKTLAGGKLTVGGVVGQWLGDGAVNSTATADYDNIVAFYVPPASDGATITVLGAEQMLVDAVTQ